MVWVWVCHIGPSSNATAAATTTSSEHRSSSIPGMSWKSTNIIANIITTSHGRLMWMRMGFKLMVLLLNSQLHRTFIDSKFTSPTEIIHEFSIKKKNDITKSCYMFSKKRHIPSTYNFINNFPLLNVNGFIQLWSQTFQQPHPGNRFLA